VRGFVAHAKHLVDELVRHLVAQHRRDLRPRPVDHERPQQLDLADRAAPRAEPRRALRQRDDRPPQLSPEQPIIEDLVPTL
jgi:hypothetical protein